MEGITELLQLIQAVFGVDPVNFTLVSLTSGILVVILRRCLQLNKRLAAFHKSEKGKLVLIVLSLACGILLAFVAQQAGVYATRNWIMTAWVGFWNGALSSLLWQGAKRVKILRGFVEGS